MWLRWAGRYVLLQQVLREQNPSLYPAPRTSSALASWTCSGGGSAGSSQLSGPSAWGNENFVRYWRCALLILDARGTCCCFKPRKIGSTVTVRPRGFISWAHRIYSDDYQGTTDARGKMGLKDHLTWIWNIFKYPWSWGSSQGTWEACLEKWQFIDLKHGFFSPLNFICLYFPWTSPQACGK